MPDLIATTSFGLEAVVKRELQALGFGKLQVSNGKVTFPAALEDIPRANLWLRSAGRVQVKMGEFAATTFDALFEQTKALPWEDWIPADGAFPVKNLRWGVCAPARPLPKKPLLNACGKSIKLPIFPKVARFTRFRSRCETIPPC